MAYKGREGVSKGRRGGRGGGNIPVRRAAVERPRAWVRRRDRGVGIFGIVKRRGYGGFAGWYLLKMGLELEMGVIQDLYSACACAALMLIPVFPLP